MEIVKVSGGMPTKLPWVEGLDYDILSGQPQIGDCVRVRDNAGERFEIKKEASTTTNSGNTDVFKSIIRLRAKALTRKDRSADALMLLKTIGE